MVVTEEIVLKALVELRDSYEKTDYDIVADKLDIDFVTLGKYLESLRRKGYITQVCQLLLTRVRSLDNPTDGSDRTSKLIRIQLTRLSPRRETGGGLPMTGRLSW